jgi:SAM-dependent methyltransferase
MGETVIIFGVHVTDEALYERVGHVWAGKLSSNDATLVESRDVPTMADGYNEILDAFCNADQIEAIVLFRQEVSVVDVDLIDKIRKAITEDAAICGLLGARTVHNLAWWEGELRGSLPDPARQVRHSSGVHEVDVIDGSFAIIDMQTARSVRFDNTLGPDFDGLIADYCMQAKSVGGRILVTDIGAFTVDAKGYSTLESFRNADERFREKWQGALSQPAPGSMRTLLDIGGGTDARDHWINIDPVHGEGEFLRGAQDAPWPIPDGHIRMIWASHVLEHVPAGGNRIRLMNEAYRVLSPGGTFEARMPSFPHWSAVADPTHVSFWVPESFGYFTGVYSAGADYGIDYWEQESMMMRDEWELRGVLRKPLPS